MPNRRTHLILLIGVAGVLAGSVAWYRLSRVTPEGDFQRYWQLQGQRAFSRMPSVPVTDRDAIRRVFEAATVQDPENLLPARSGGIESLRDAVLGFVVARYSARTPAEYIEWMESRGYQFKTLAEFEQDHGPIKGLQDLVGVAGMNPRPVFEAVWEYGMPRGAQPNEVCTDPAAVAIAIGRSNHNRFITEEIGGILGYKVWHGGSGGKCRFWMRPPVTRAEIISERGEAIAAQVGLIGCVPGSDRRPIIVSVFQDPATSQWWIDGVGVTNYLPPSGKAMCAEY